VEFASDEDLVTELGRLASSTLKEGGEKFFEDVQKSAQEGKFLDVLTKFLADGNDVIAAEKDAEVAFLLAFSLAKKQTAEAQRDTIVPQMISVLTSSTDDKPQFRLRLLNHAYNILTAPAVRFELFLSILKYAVASQSEASVADVHTDVERLSKAWNVKPEQLREVYKLLRDIFRNRKQAEQAHEWTVKYFELFKNDADASSVADDAVRGIVEAINLNGLYSFDAIVELSPIKQLEKQNPAAWKLLNVFVSGTLDDYRSLDLAPFKAVGLDEQQSETKIRYLTIASVCNESAQVPYASVAKALQIDESEVETYVVNAISDGIVEGRLDQLRRIVNVSRTIQRQFSRTQWVQLNDTLQAWRTNVKGLLQSIDSVREQQFTQHPYSAQVQH